MSNLLLNVSVFQGFFELISLDLIKLFDENELEVSIPASVNTRCPLHYRVFNFFFLSPISVCV